MSNEESSAIEQPEGNAEAQEPAPQAPPHTHTLPLPGEGFEECEQEQAGDDARAGHKLAAKAAVVNALASGSANLDGVVISERYQVGECLGVGGMGTVWRAEHMLMKKTVAIKVLHRDIVGRGEAVERFRREAQAAAHIDHPNVCVATDFGEMDERGFFLVMEYLEGETLDETLAKVERLNPERAIHIADQILAALEQAHQHGVVHRDLKPENIMLVERDGDPDFVKIMDFGIARVPMAEEQDDARLTRVGRIYGTPMYMSPEQASGETGIDARSDLYTLGVILFEMLSGALPYFHKSSAKVMAMHLTEAVPSLRQRVPEARLPKRLDRLVARLMAKDRDDRPASAGEVRAELASINQGGHTETWVSVTREAVDASSVAIRRAARPLAPYLSRARAWGQENPLAQKLILAGLLIMLLSVPLAVLVYAFSPTSEDTAAQSAGEQQSSLATERRLFLEDIDASSVINALAMGDAQGALEQTAALAVEHGANAHLHFLRARAQMMNQDPEAALREYQKALDADPRYAKVERLQNDILAQFRSGDEDMRALAEDLLINALPPEKTNQSLSEIARMGKGSALRARAKNALEKAGRLKELDLWNRASIELRFAQGCTAHRDAIDKLVDANDSRGLEVLYYYDERPRKGCGTFKREDCYGCIRKDLEKAIQTIPPPTVANPEASGEIPTSATIGELP